MASSALGALAFDIPDRTIPCSICGTTHGMLCLFHDFDGKALTIHPRCGKNPTHDLHILSTAKVFQRFGQGSESAIRKGVAAGKIRTATGPGAFGNMSTMYIVADCEAVLREQGFFAKQAAAQAEQAKKPPANPYLRRVWEGAEATSLAKLMELGHLGSKAWLDGSSVHSVRKNCRAYRAGLLVIDTKKKAFRWKGKVWPVYKLDSKFAQVRIAAAATGGSSQSSQSSSKSSKSSSKSNSDSKSRSPSSKSSSSKRKSKSTAAAHMFACPDCDKSYTNEAGLYQHRYLKHNFRKSNRKSPSTTTKKRKRMGTAGAAAVRAFACPDCDKSYAKKAGLYQHRYLKHNLREDKRTK